MKVCSKNKFNEIKTKKSKMIIRQEIKFEIFGRPRFCEKLLK